MNATSNKAPMMASMPASKFVFVLVPGRLVGGGVMAGGEITTGVSSGLWEGATDGLGDGLTDGDGLGDGLGDGGGVPE